MQSQDFIADDDSQPVMVPRSDRALVPTRPKRVRRLRRHLAAALLASRAVTDPKRSVSPLLPEPEGFAGHVARTAVRFAKVGAAGTARMMRFWMNGRWHACAAQGRRWMRAQYFICISNEFPTSATLTHAFFTENEAAHWIDCRAVVNDAKPVEEHQWVATASNVIICG
jgi:hypothetical protein